MERNTLNKSLFVIGYWLFEDPNSSYQHLMIISYELTNSE